MSRDRGSSGEAPASLSVPVAISATRLAKPGRASDLTAWALRLGEGAAQFPGYQRHDVSHTGVGQILTTISFATATEAAAWERSDQRASLLDEGVEYTDLILLGTPRPAAAPSRLRSIAMVWLALFPFALLLNAVGGPFFAGLALLPRTLVTTLTTVPLVVVFGIPVVNRLWPPHRRWPRWTLSRRGPS